MGVMPLTSRFWVSLEISGNSDRWVFLFLRLFVLMFLLGYGSGENG